MRNLMKGLLICVITLMAVSCSKEDNLNANQFAKKSFVTKKATDFFVNRDGSVNVTVNGGFQDPRGEGEERGFVYGESSNPLVNLNNTIVAAGPIQENVFGVFRNIAKGKVYYVRGYFRLKNGSYFYGKEIVFNTNIDASKTRKLSMEMLAKPHWVSSTEMTPQLDVTELEKESPKEIGFEYSVNKDFSNSKKALAKDIKGNIRVTKYAVLVIKGLTAKTTYYFRPYAEYNDGTVTNGGKSVVELTTK